MKNLENTISQLSARITLLENKVSVLMGEKQAVFTQNLPRRDKTKYLFEGSIYGKNQLVLAVVKAYTNKYTNLSFNNLLEAFDKSLQGSLGVIAKMEDIKQKPDAKKRFFIGSPLQLFDTLVVVCTQWGAFNIGKFILRAKELDFDIKEV